MCCNILEAAITEKIDRVIHTDVPVEHLINL